MKKLITVLFVLSLLSGCSYSSIEGGEEAALTYKPWIFGHGGVDPIALTTGAAYTAWSTGVERYNIKPHQYSERFVDLTASDNVAIDFNSYVTLQIVKGDTPILHEKFGHGWYENRVKEAYRTMVRNEGRTKSSIQLRTNVAAINDSQDKILAELKEYLAAQGIPVTASKVVIGKVNPPQGVLDEAERTASQKQREKTQIAKAKTEKLRALAEKEAALADKAYSKEFNMTTEQFLRNKELDIIAGKKNVSVVMGVTPFVQVK